MARHNKCKTAYTVLKEEFLKGKTLEQIGKEYRCSRRDLSNRLKLDGVHINTHNKKYKHNDTVFDKIDTEEKAYWLGFLFADGCCSSFNPCVTLSLQERDRDHLEKFKQFISPEQSLRYLPKVRAFQLSVGSKKLHSALGSLGCTPRKSLTLEFPLTKLPPSLIHHFIRGYFDGDGCVSYSSKKKVLSLNILGTEQFLTALQGIFEAKVKGYTKVKIGRKGSTRIYMWQKNTNKQILCIYKFLYRNATVFLQRKHQVFNQLAVHNSNVMDHDSDKNLEP